MRILSVEQHRELDAATLSADGISSLQLMERAANAWAKRFCELYPKKDRHITVLAGPGNNGGDGLVIARLLRFETYDVSILLASLAPASPDNQANQRRAKDVGVPLRILQENEPLPDYPAGSIVIDALFGTGLSRPVEGFGGRLIGQLNASPVLRIAVDLPSGLFADRNSVGHIVQAHRTLSLGYPKLALFSPANTAYLGRWELVPFAVAHDFVEGLSVQYRMLTRDGVAARLRERHANDHKGTFGHALLVAGAFGKMGAAVICARAVLRAGAGLVTAHLPRIGYEIMQISFPEAMCSVDHHRYHFTAVTQNLDQYDTIGIGPGLGTDESTQTGLRELIEAYRKPMVIDADALNLLAQEPERLAALPAGSILTPHPKEFERLFGETDDDFSRWELQRSKARELKLVILLKTGFTTVAMPDGTLYFNTTGNPGMGTGGTGDALTGILTGLLAQSYTSADAAPLGVYLHGLAGDLAAEELEQESLLAEDVVSHLGKAYRQLHASKSQP